MKNKRKILGLSAVASLLSLSAVLASCDKVKEYTVTFKNGSETVTTQSVPSGFNAKVPEAPTGVTEFNGWYKDAALTEPFDFGSVITEDTTVYARWVKNYTVTFDSKGGSQVDSKTVKEGYNVAVPTAPTGDTEFNGWYSDSALTTPFNFGTVITSDTTVYAKWIKNYTVTFDSKGGSAVDPAVVREGFGINMPADPRKDDADFVGWYTDAALTTPYSFGSAVTADTTLYAKWAPLPEVTAITMNGVAYDSIALALAAIPANSTDTFVITLPVGTYEENGLVYDGSATVHIKGNTRALYGSNVVIKGHGSDMTQERSRNLISIRGTGNIILENLTLESDWTRTMAGSNNAQAEVLGTDTKGYTVAYNCGFKSHQDTLRTAGKAWFYGCYVEGDVDFLWMEQAGSVALYENCEIVSVRDHDEASTATSTYFAAPRMAKVKKVGKGLVIYNSVCKESDDARESGQTTYMARNPWSGSSDYYNQVAYINVDVSDIEAKIWYNDPTATEFPKTAVGYKMDQATATKLGYAGNGDILSDEEVEKEFGGREAIINRVYNTGKLKYEKDQNYWDINALIRAQGWKVDEDTSSATSADEAGISTTTYKFDGSQDLSALTIEGFAAHSSGSYAGGAGATITVPVTGKGYVEVYGFYAGTVETEAATQGMQVMFFNNSTTSAEVENDYIIYDAATSTVTITAKGTTYITKIAVVNDTTTEKVDVTQIEVTGNTKNYCVGVPLKLTAKVTPGTAVNKSVIWSSSNESVGVIDKYTGKVTFLTAGDVVFTATATDGSNVYGTFACSPINPTWVAAEWYTTDKGNTEKLANEAGATEIGVFDVGGSSNKDLKIGSTMTTFTFTNIKGDEIETQEGLKLNSAGSLSFATTKGNATLTVITVKAINEYATPIVSDGTNNAKLLRKTENADGTVTYLYEIAKAGVWKISRGDETKECNPILYAKVEYELRITKDTFVNFKGGAFHPELEDEVNLNHNNGESGSSVDSTSKITYDNFTYEGAVSNGKENWLTFNTGAKISFTVADLCVLKIRFYSGSNQVKVTLDGEEVACFKKNGKEAIPDCYYLEAAGDVVIEATGNCYLGCFDIIMGEEAPEPDPEPVNDTFDANAVIDFSSTAALTASLANEKITYAANFTSNDHTDSIQLNGANSSFSFKVKAGAKVTVTSFGSGYGYLLIDGVSNNSEVTYTKTYTEDATVTIAAENSEATGNAWNKSYLKKIEITYPAPTITENTELLFGTSGNYAAAKAFEIDAQVGDNGGNNSQVKNGTIKFKVAAGAQVEVYANWGEDYTITLADGTTEEHVGTGVGNAGQRFYTYDTASEVTITCGTTGNNYFYWIKVTFPAPTITEATDLLFGTSGNYATAKAFEIDAQVVDNGGNNSQVKNGTVKFKVAAGAKVEVYANWGEDYTITLADGTTEEHVGTGVGNAGQRFYTYATATEITITCGTTGNNYFYWIKVTFPTE